MDAISGEPASLRPGLAGRSLALAFATIERPLVAQRLILSARRIFPDMPIYVADQSLTVSAMESFYAAMDVTLVRMPYDAGVCASRNRLAAAISEDFFVLCDDDFVFGAITDFEDALHILRHHPQIGVVGGKLFDYDGTLREEYARHWELFLHLDRTNRTLTSVPITRYAPVARELGTIRFYMCDAVMNFAVIRRSIFGQSVIGQDGAAPAPGIGWDERFKSNGEHEDFFLNLKENSAIRVAYLPTMIAFHHHPEAFAAYRKCLRDRVEGWKRFFAKWGIDQHLEIGLGVRTIDDFDAVIPGEDAEARFYINDDLSLRRARSDRDVLQVTGATRLSAVGLLDENGARRPSAPATARLLVHDRRGVRAGPDDDLPFRVRLRRAARMAETIEDRYRLEPPVAALPDRRRPALFRYNPVARAEADFILWHRPVAGQGSTFPRADRLKLTLRWTAEDASVLVWESRPYVLPLDAGAYWSPLLVDMPVWPAGARYLRFDLVGEAASGRYPLAIGFVFAAAAGTAAADSAGEISAFDVLAVSPWTDAEAAAAPWQAADLAGLPDFPAALPLHVRTYAPAPAMALLDLGALGEGEILLIADWPGLGTPVAYARPGTGRCPGHIAVPWCDTDRQAGRLIRFLPAEGLRAARLAVIAS